MYRNIVVGLDGSLRAPIVLGQALELARLHQAKLYLVRAMLAPVSLPAVVWTLKGDDLGQFLVDHGRQELEVAARDVPAESLGGIDSRLGKPSDVICRVAEERNADLVVIGTHGYDSVDRLLGTTAARVTNRAPCSVLVVRSIGG